MKKIFLYCFFLAQITALGQEINLNSIQIQNIGPTIMSGRVVDLAVNPDNPIEFYAAYASGGVWYTNNNGNSFEPIMDAAPTLNCGSIAVDWKTKTIWVGTGEVNSSRSSYAGVGLLKTTNNGKTWENLGLKDSHHIASVWINPSNNNEIVVGVTGHLYSKNSERGVFKSNDGGKTWMQTLFVNNETGIIDLVVSEQNSKIMYAAAWEKMREAWNFKGNGKNSGIYKSVDAGTTWVKISETSGFPSNEGIGRIGLTLYDENTVYAVVDNQNLRPYSKIEKTKDANAALFETEIIGAEVYKTEDGGMTWKKTHDTFIEDCFYTYGYYFGDITVSKSNSQRIYISGVPLLCSNDGGKTFESINRENVHADHHVVWTNPKNPNHIINANDGGVNISYDNGKHWIKCNNQQVGQFYTVNVDNQDNYKIYGGLQDNGVWVGPNDYSHSYDWQQEGKYPYESIMGGDGMQVQIDNTNSNIVYTGFQFGNYFRIDRKNNITESITPRSEDKKNPFRFNWQTPILLSSHNNDIVYFGSNFLHRSMNQGKKWDVISPDLTNGKVEGNVPFGTISSIAESNFQFGLLLVGTDDGNVQLSKDGGVNWAKISTQLPQKLWVSRVRFSKFRKERIYVTLNGYRSDDFQSYVYVSDDLGQNWRSISNGLQQAVNVILEDSENGNILYAGTDNGLYVSFNGGEMWQLFSENIPKVAIHDLVIQNKAKDLIIGTHGRSIYKLNLNIIYQMDVAIKRSNDALLKIEDCKESKYWGNKTYTWGELVLPNVEIYCFLTTTKNAEIVIKNKEGYIVFSQKLENKEGLNKIDYDLSINEKTKWLLEKKDPILKIHKGDNGKYYLPVGKYSVVLMIDNKMLTETFEIKKNM